MIKYIKPLPISEEILGAYLEGNLTPSDVRYVEHIIENNSDFSAFVDELAIAEDLDSGYYTDEMANYDNFILPEIPINVEPFIDNHILPFDFEPSFGEFAACAIMPEIVDDGYNCDLNIENTIFDNSINEYSSPSDNDLIDYNEDSNMFNDNCIDFL